MELDNIVDEVVKKIEQMKDGEKSGISALIGRHLEVKDYIYVQEKVVEVLRKKAIILDYSEHEGKEVGVPWVISFIKRTESK